MSCILIAIANSLLSKIGRFSWPQRGLYFKELLKQVKKLVTEQVLNDEHIDSMKFSHKKYLLGEAYNNFIFFFMDMLSDVSRSSQVGTQYCSIVTIV